MELAAEKSFQPIVSQALGEGFSLFDLRKLRPLLSAARTKTADPELMRIVHGFDALLVLGSLNENGLEACRGYIQHWLNGQEIPERSAQRIFKAADTILRAGRVDTMPVLAAA